MSCLTGPAGADPSDRKGITIMTSQQHRVGGVDSHKDTIHVAVITKVGQPVTDKEFPTTTAGYRRAVAWLARPGTLAQERALAVSMAAARAAEYVAFARVAKETVSKTAPDRAKVVVQLRRQWREITRRDFFPPPERDLAATALRELRTARTPARTATGPDDYSVPQ